MKFYKSLLDSADFEIARLKLEIEKLEKEMKIQYAIKDFMELLRDKEGKRPGREEE